MGSGVNGQGLGLWARATYGQEEGDESLGGKVNGCFMFSKFESVERKTIKIVYFPEKLKNIEIKVLQYFSRFENLENLEIGPFQDFSRLKVLIQDSSRLKNLEKS